MIRTLLSGICLAALPLWAAAQPAPALTVDRATGTIDYAVEADGDRMPDYSHAGYALSETGIPWVEAKVFVRHRPGDMTARVQAAIDHVSHLAPDAEGFRGAVLLDTGTFRLDGTLRLHTSGVVLRGQGFGEGGTVLFGTGTTREPFIRMEGKDDRKLDTPVAVTDHYLPVNASALTVADAAGFKKGDRVRVRRPSTEAWILEVQCDTFGGNLFNMRWKPGDKDLFFDRRITAVEGNRITLDAPLTNSTDARYGGATLVRYDWPGRVEKVGVEGIAFVSDYDRTNEKDEDHRWFGVILNNIENGWVRQARFRHLAGSAVFVQEGAAKITVEDCVSEAPVSEIGGFRRYTYYTMGQQVLFQRCAAIGGGRDFAIGQCATGPTAFVNCESLYPHGFSGGVASWATGVLFDQVRIEGGVILMKNRGQDDNGAGWNLANSTLWNTTAARIENYRPPTAQNWVIGPWAKYKGDGYWYEEDSHVQPRTLFYAQLRARTGRDDSARARLRPYGAGDQTTAPTVELAARLSEEAKTPAVTLAEWISEARIPKAMSDKAGLSEDFAVPSPTKKQPGNLSNVNGKIVLDGRLLTGTSTGTTRYWNGSLNPSFVNTTTTHITRFVPGRSGHGLTDDLDSMSSRMVELNQVYINHMPGLWYERRRDDHERFLREDAEVWAPFYEQPYARSGRGEAWDRLSQYDLTKFNAFYFSRLREFAELGREKGVVVIDQHYNQHNIIEAGAHWVDFPWRSANNVNETGFPEPVHFAGDKRIFMAEQYYDTSNAHRMALHRGHWRHHLENYPDGSGVIHSLSSEYTGPVKFMAAWVEFVHGWQQETGRDPLIALGATKDVQDSILSVPALAAVIDVIDINYWLYRADGSLYAPKGGLSLAPRQHARLTPIGTASAASVYRAVREYRDRYPDKAVIYRQVGSTEYPWAILFAGGSLAGIPRVEAEGFVEAVAAMNPVNAPESADWQLVGETGSLFYREDGTPAPVALAPGRYEKIVIDPATGKTLSRERVAVRKDESVQMPVGQIVWMRAR